MFDTLSAPTRPWLDELNDRQRQAATHGEGPLLVIAGAGSGKTKTLACRVAYLVDSGVAPERILLLTFTRRAARELLSRAERMAGRENGATVWGGTFHSVANRLLRIHGRALGLDPAFTILDHSDSAELMDLLRSELGLGKGERRFPKKDTLAAIYSRTVNSGTKLKDVLERHFPWCADDIEGIRVIFEAYVVRKRDHSVLDYDDLLLFWNVMASSPGVGDKMGSMFDHILVDEYQDTNALQANILKKMRRTNNNITVVGDDAQAIYSFRSATVQNILDFPEQHGGATIVTLDRNYRSTQPILDASNAVIAGARKRYTKDLWTDLGGAQRPTLLTCLDEMQQCEEVCARVLEHREQGTALHEQAVLFRAGHHSTMLEFELTRRNIPFVKYGGLRFIETAHVKDVLAFLRILENPYDELGWFRVLQLLKGVGPAAARRVMTELGVRPATREEGISPLVKLVDVPPAVPPAAVNELSELCATVAECIGVEAPAIQIDRIGSFLEPIFGRIYEAAASRMRDVEQLSQIASGYASRGRFITDITLDPPDATGDLAGPPALDEDYLVLSTMHSAKGCEWDVVHVIHVADGMIPSDMALGDDDELDEERRLFYVALTRARNDLHLYFPLRYYYRPVGAGDAHTYAQLSRFLTPEVAKLFERTSLADTQATTAQAGGGPGNAAGAVADFLQELWKF